MANRSPLHGATFRAARFVAESLDCDNFAFGLIEEAVSTCIARVRVDEAFVTRTSVAQKRVTASSIGATSMATVLTFIDHRYFSARDAIAAESFVTFASESLKAIRACRIGRAVCGCTVVHIIHRAGSTEDLFVANIGPKSLGRTGRVTLNSSIDRKLTCNSLINIP